MQQITYPLVVIVEELEVHKMMFINGMVHHGQVVEQQVQIHSCYLLVVIQQMHYGVVVIMEVVHYQQHKLMMEVVGQQYQV